MGPANRNETKMTVCNTTQSSLSTHYRRTDTRWGCWHQRADERLGDPPPKVVPRAFSGQRRMEDPQEDPLAVHCFCVCSGSALLGDLLGVSRSMGCDLLFVLLIYPRIFLHVFIVYRLLIGFLYV